MVSFRGYITKKFPDGRLVKSDHGDEYNIQCPRCSHEATKAYINLKTGEGHCFHCSWFRYN